MFEADSIKKGVNSMTQFWEETFWKVIYTMAEAAIGVIGTATLLQEVDWGFLISTVILAGAVTILKCIAVDLPNVRSADEMMEEEVEDDDME